MKERVPVSGRTAVISGAASGIGRALAVRLAAHGCALALSDWDETGLKEDRGAGEYTGAVPGARRPRSRRPTRLGRRRRRLGADPPGRRINNAGVVLTQWAAQADYDDDKWLMDINFWGVAHGTPGLFAAFDQSGLRRVVNMSSIFGLCAFPSQSAYCAAEIRCPRLHRSRSPGTARDGRARRYGAPGRGADTDHPQWPHPGRSAGRSGPRKVPPQFLGAGPDLAGTSRRDHSPRCHSAARRGSWSGSTRG